jgi:broad specificity phosphatase PhoE
LRGRETLEAVSVRAGRVIDRICALEGDVLVFVHRDILRILAARWLRLTPWKLAIFISLRHYSVFSVTHHDLDEPVMRLGNDTKR